MNRQPTSQTTVGPVATIKPLLKAGHYCGSLLLHVLAIYVDDFVHLLCSGCFTFKEAEYSLVC